MVKFATMYEDGSGHIALARGDDGRYGLWVGNEQNGRFRSVYPGGKQEAFAALQSWTAGPLTSAGWEWLNRGEQPTQ